MAEQPKPYTSSELMEMAIRPAGYRDIDVRRVLATYADPANWTQVYADQRCYWSWNGPTIVGYEFAGHALKYTADRARVGADSEASTETSPRART